ncbi:MAG: hypothetical protein HY963_09000 [Ignavibacteriales bacterium]|nr:hypothetical protein [Ignavibacteriales bacterium]
MKKAIALLMLTIFLFASYNIISKTSSIESSSDLVIQTAKTQNSASRDLIEGFHKLTSDKNLKSGLHTIFKSSNGTMYCVKLKDGKVDKLIVTSSEGNPVKPRIIKAKGKNAQCTVCVTISQKPLVEECWEWICN